MFLIKIVTPKQEFLIKEVDKLIVRGVDGDFACLPNMTDTIVRLECSSGYYKIGEEIFAFSISGGVFSMFDGEAVVITTYAKFETFTKTEVTENTSKLVKFNHDEIKEYFKS